MLSLRHHHLDKLFIVDLTITIDVRFPNHFINFLICQFLTKVRHHMTELGSTDETVAVTIKDLECLNQLLLSVSILHLACHQGQKLGKVDRAVSVCVKRERYGLPVDWVPEGCLAGCPC